ncbi:MAG TPA: alpha/beta hydrolase [Polyangiaceae bacterium LLY-WYZ-14_1]|nr:alpha/beta hydrolase [Polyangiaceae bacterium LLY-WYZ-14_1]
MELRREGDGGAGALSLTARLSPVSRTEVSSRGTRQPDTVILVHSSGLGGGQWRKVAPMLAAGGLEVLVPDLVGYGESPPWISEGVAGGDASALAGDVAGLVGLIDRVRGSAAPTAPPGRVHLVGHSYGGVVALQAARERPDVVGRLVLFEPVLFGLIRRQVSPDRLRSYLPFDEGFFARDPDGGVADFLERLVDFWNGPGAWAALGPERRAPFLAAGHKVRAEVVAVAVAREDGDREGYRGVPAPTLVVTGGRTAPPVGAALGAAVAAELPDATHVVMEDAGHMGPVTHPDVFVPLTLAHLAGR